MRPIPKLWQQHADPAQPTAIGFRHGYGYDAARRPTHVLAQTPADTALVLVERTLYGEAWTDPAGGPTPDDPEDRNLRGRVVAVYDGGGLVRTDEYDFAGRPLDTTRRYATFTIPATPPADWEPTPSWDLLLASDDATAVESDLDTNHAGTLEAASHKTTIEWDAFGRPVQVTTPDGLQTKRTWNDGGQLETVVIDNGTTTEDYLDDVQYDAHGRRTRVDYGPGTYSEYTYDATTQRLTRLQSTKSDNSTKLQDLTYWYDAVGSVVEIGDAATQTVYFANMAVGTERRYVYDSRYRLIQATGREHVSIAVAWDRHFWQGDDGGAPPNARAPQDLPSQTQNEAMRRYTETFTYDAAGNFTQVAHSAPAATGPVPANNWTRTYQTDPDGNRLISTTVGAITETYDHDGRGAMRRMDHMPTAIDGASVMQQGMVWNHSGRLVRTRHGSGAGTYYVYYQYDGSGRRVRKIRVDDQMVVDRETIYVGDYERYRKWVVTSTYDHEVETVHLSDDRRRFAMREQLNKDNGSTAGLPVVVERFNLVDHLSSAAVEFDGSEKLLTYEEYYPYGVVSFSGKSSTNDKAWARKRYRFTAQERDEESGLQVHHHRYYAPWLGRWSRPDPAGVSDGLNRFAYVGGDPVGGLDPAGLGRRGHENYGDFLMELVEENANDPKVAEDRERLMNVEIIDDDVIFKMFVGVAAIFLGFLAIVGAISAGAGATGMAALEASGASADAVVVGMAPTELLAAERYVEALLFRGIPIVTNSRRASVVAAFFHRLPASARDFFVELWQGAASILGRAKGSVQEKLADIGRYAARKLDDFKQRRLGDGGPPALGGRAGPLDDVARGADEGVEASKGVGAVADDFAEMSGMLRDAAKGKGNFGIGAGTREQAEAMGKAWVGEGFKVASDGKTLVSADGLRQYRPPSYKPNLDKVQANFERRFEGQTTNQWQGNAHLDVTD